MVGVRDTKVMFRNALEEALSGRYVDGGTHNVVIICHGLMANKDSSFLPALAVKLAHKRLSSLRFDYSGIGKSQGVLEYSPFAKELSDLRAAVDFIRNTMGKASCAGGVANVEAAALMQLAVRAPGDVVRHPHVS